MLAHPVVACLCKERNIHTGSPQRHYAVEGRATRHCLCWLAVFEDNVEHGFAYTYYFSHIINITYILLVLDGCKFPKFS